MANGFPRFQLSQDTNDLILAVTLPFFPAINHAICPLLVLIKHSDLLWYKFRGQGHILNEIQKVFCY